MVADVQSEIVMRFLVNFVETSKKKRTTTIGRGTVEDAGMEYVGSWNMRKVATIFEVPLFKTSGSMVTGAPGVGVFETTDLGGRGGHMFLQYNR